MKNLMKATGTALFFAAGLERINETRKLLI
jgi:hypothetical protein